MISVPRVPGDRRASVAEARSSRDRSDSGRGIRAARFGRVRFGKRGLDPDEVRQFLTRVALEVANLQAELDRVRQEAGRIRTALREWQTRYGNQRNSYGRNFPKKDMR